MKETIIQQVNDWLRDLFFDPIAMEYDQLLAKLCTQFARSEKHAKKILDLMFRANELERIGDKVTGGPELLIGAIRLEKILKPMTPVEQVKFLENMEKAAKQDKEATIKRAAVIE